MNERIKFIAAVAAICATLLVGYAFRGATHRCPECPACPELVSRSHIERDSIIPHDTARIAKYAPSITRRTVPATPTVASVSVDTQTPDSMISYEVIDTMPDAAIIGFAIASRELPDRYLPDLTHVAWYIAKPDRIRIISDTLTVQLPPLKCPTRWRRDITIGGVCIGIGAVAATSYFILR